MIDRAFIALFEVMTVIGGIVGLICMYLAVITGIGAGGAMNMAALSAFGVAAVAIPYCLAGSVHRSVMRRLAREASERETTTP